MTAEHSATDESAGAAPVACTLTPAGLAAQARRWEQLAGRAMTGRTETGNGLRISFRAGAGAEDELRDLVAVEKECCRWADWAVRATGSRLVLDVRSTGAGIAALHGMFSGLDGPTSTE